MKKKQEFIRITNLSCLNGYHGSLSIFAEDEVVKINISIAYPYPKGQDFAEELYEMILKYNPSIVPFSLKHQKKT